MSDPNEDDVDYSQIARSQITRLASICSQLRKCSKNVGIFLDGVAYTIHGVKPLPEGNFLLLNPGGNTEEQNWEWHKITPEIGVIPNIHEFLREE